MSASATGLQESVADSQSRPADFSSRHKAIASLLLAAATLAFYNPVGRCGFVYSDDLVYVMRNPAVQAGLTWATVKWAFVGVHAGFWHPLTWLSHALDFQLFGMNPAAHHYMSLLIHSANAVLLFLLLIEATSAAWPSLLVAALFVLHPENVESVAWAAERKNVLSMFFFLLALWAYGRYARRGGIARYFSVVTFYALGFMAKPQVITLPFVLLLWDYWPLRRMSACSGDAPTPRTSAYLIREKIPLFLLAAVGSAVTVWTQKAGTAVQTLSDFPLSARLGNAAVAYMRYLAHTFWPVRLAPIYPHPGVPPTTQVAAAVTVLAAMTAFVIWKRDRRYLLVGWLWFLGTLVPMIGIVQVGEQAMADRFAYIPIIGVLVAVVWGAQDVIESKRIAKPWTAIPAMIVLVMLGVLTYRQLGCWRDGETLWRYDARATDPNYLAHVNLAMVFDGEGRPADAIKEFLASESMHDYPPEQLLKMGLYAQRNGNFAAAIEQYEKATHAVSNPQIRAEAWSQAGSAYVRMARYDQAMLDYQRALDANPDYTLALVATALLAERDDGFDQASEQLSHAMKVQPSDAGYLLLADALRQAGRAEEAQSAESIAQKISQNFSQAKAIAAQTKMFFGLEASGS